MLTFTIWLVLASQQKGMRVTLYLHDDPPLTFHVLSKLANKDSALTVDINTREFDISFLFQYALNYSYSQRFDT